MKYMGSKNRHSKDILNFIGEPSIYVEPFCGGCNIIDKVKSPLRIAGDIDEDLINMWQAVSNGWMPPKNFTENDYNNLKSENVSPERGYAAFALSYGGKKWGGWRRDKDGKRNYIDEAYRNAERQFPLLRGVKFYNASYDELYIPVGAVIYCDPPYKGTTGYSKHFCHEKFWEWVRKKINTNTVFISEYQAPSDFKSIWEKRVSSSLTSDTGSKTNTEKLWVAK